MSVPNHLKKIISNLPESSGIYKFLDEKDTYSILENQKTLRSE